MEQHDLHVPRGARPNTALRVVAMGLAGLLATAASMAQNPQAAAAGAKKAEAKPAAAKAVKKKAKKPALPPSAADELTAIRKKQQFRFTSGGLRDPMTFRMYTKPKAPPKPVAPTPKEGDGSEKKIEKPEGPKHDVEESRRVLTAYLIQSKAAFRVGNYDESLRFCKEALAKAEDWTGLVDEQVLRLQGEIASLRETALRREKAAAIEKKFEGLPIAISGVRVGEGGDRAIINNVIVEPGQYVEVSGQRLQVEAIEDDGVIFRYEGQKLRKGLFELDDTGTGASVK